MTHVDGTYDTYACKDCDTVLSGYKRGDPFLHEHVQSGEGKCRYIKRMFRGREGDLEVLQGKLRFQRGQLAFPAYMLYAVYGYVTISGMGYCVICSSQSGEKHYMACSDMNNRLKALLKDMKLPVVISETPLFTREPRSDRRQTQRFDGQAATDFRVLGDSANMYHVPHTVDTHKCATCDLQIWSFVKNDTLLGEHIYHSYNTGRYCRYIADRFSTRPHKLLAIVGKERFRKGYIAFPDIISNACYGYIVVGGRTRCSVCSTMTIQGKYLPPKGHARHCHEMVQKLKQMLEHTHLLP